MINLLHEAGEPPPPAAAEEGAAGGAAVPARGDVASDAIRGGAAAVADVELGTLGHASAEAPRTPAVPRRSRRLRLPGLSRGGGASASDDEEISASHSDEADAAARRLFATADEVNAGIASIRGALAQLRELHSADLQASRPDVVKSLRAQMVRDIAGTSRTAAKVKRQIEALASEARRAEAAHGGGGASERMHSTVAVALEIKFRDVMRDFSELRAVLHADHAAVVARRYAAVVGHAPGEEELATLAGDAPADAAERIFSTALKAQGRSAEPLAARAALAEVHERHDAIVELEKGLEHLHQMFLGASFALAAGFHDPAAQARHRAVPAPSRARHGDAGGPAG
jgi:t-SNARE complex subunit (syntaxin)